MIYTNIPIQLLSSANTGKVWSWQLNTKNILQDQRFNFPEVSSNSYQTPEFSRISLGRMNHVVLWSFVTKFTEYGTTNSTNFMTIHTCRKIAEKMLMINEGVVWNTSASVENMRKQE